MAYQLHKADILNRIEVRNASQFDWMIAVRMRVTGHDQQAVTQALMENASQGREAEKRNWTNYAERADEAVFGPRGARECARSDQRADAWARVEGRNTTFRLILGSHDRSFAVNLEKLSCSEQRTLIAQGQGASESISVPVYALRCSLPWKRPPNAVAIA
jgi:hypothetical protein